MANKVRHARKVPLAPRKLKLSHREALRLLEMMEASGNDAVESIADEIMGMLDRHPFFRGLCVSVIKALSKRKPARKLVLPTKPSRKHSSK